MSDLRIAAKRALEAYDAHDPLAVVMEDLRAALTEDAMQKFTDVNQELEAALADTKVDSQAIANQPSPPPEAQTEAEQIAYCAGWWDALAKARASSTCEPLPPASPSQT